MNDKRYYWLKLEENYFDLKVQKALRKLPSGSDMLICYLKMQLKYLNTGGIIEYQGICGDLAQELAMDIDEEEDLVKMTLALLEKWKVIEPCNEGIYLAEMQDRIGSKSDVALRVAKHREKQKMLHCNNNVTKCNSIKDIDIEKDIDKETNKESDCCSYVEQNFGRLLTPLEIEKIKMWQEDFTNEEIKRAVKEAVMNNKRTFNYINGILKNWKANGVSEELPNWFGKDIKQQEMTEEEKKELEELLNNF